jgi:hypothetical protein
MGLTPGREYASAPVYWLPLVPATVPLAPLRLHRYCLCDAIAFLSCAETAMGVLGDRIWCVMMTDAR